MSPVLLAVVIVLALVMAYYNGFHDASNAVSTAITTRSLRESTALAMAAILNVLGALLGMLLLAVTAQWAVSLLGLGQLSHAAGGSPELLGTALVAILLATLSWEVITWWYGMPSSTWHSFFGGTIGASLAVGADAAWDRLAVILVVSLVGPVVAAVVAYLIMHVLLALGRGERLSIGHLRFAQTVSAGAVAAGHGLSDARLPLAVVVLATSTAGVHIGESLALMLPVALAVGAGTLMGGHRIIRTIGRRLADLSVAQGLAAETSAVVFMTLGVFGLDSPISSSQSLASSVAGAGVAMGPRHVRWAVARSIVLIWLVTPVATIVVAAAVAGVMVELRAG